jgi:hypothetical protein
MLQFFVMQKSWKPKSYGLLKLKNKGVMPTTIRLMDFNLVQWCILNLFRELVSGWKCINKRVLHHMNWRYHTIDFWMLEKNHHIFKSS